ncbi:MAG: hypothetical protein ABR552_11710, partial [Actinomycetota bacterium]
MGTKGRARALLFSILFAVVGLGVPARASGPCSPADLHPALHEFMVNQGLPYSGVGGASLVRGKSALVRLFLSMPDCSTSSSLAITGAQLDVYNNTAQPPIAQGKLFAPLRATALPSWYATTPAPTLQSDPFFAVPGSSLTPCGGVTPCAPDAFTATFKATVTFTVDGAVQQYVFATTKLIQQRTNALRILVVPMGDPAKDYRSQFSLSAEGATRSGVATLDRIFPVPDGVGELCPPPPPGARCGASQFGGIRYHIDLSAMVNLRDPRLGNPLNNFPDGTHFCGGGGNFDGIKQQLAQLLSLWNTTHPENSADIALGVLDENISASGNLGCVDGMGAVANPSSADPTNPGREAWARAIWMPGSAPRTGSLMGMEIAHTFGVVYPGSGGRGQTYHSNVVKADATVPGRAYNVDQRAQITQSHSVMYYNNVDSPWSNDNTLFEPLDSGDALCLLNGPISTDCLTPPAIPVGSSTGVAGGSTIVATGTSAGTPETTEVDQSYVTDDVANTPSDPHSRYRLVEKNLNGDRAVMGIPVFATSSAHTQTTSGNTSNDSTTSQEVSFSFALHDGVSATTFGLWHCDQPAGTQALQECENAPDLPVDAPAGTHIYGRDKATAPTFTDAKALGAGPATEYSTPSFGGNDESPTLSVDLAQPGADPKWIAFAQTDGSFLSSQIVFASTSDITSSLVIPGSASRTPSICPGGTDTSETL